MVTSNRRLFLRGSSALVCAGVGTVLLLRKDEIASALTSPSADRMTDELLRAAERADLCSAKNAVGTGLRGEYFAKEGLQGPVQLVRVDEVIDFDRSISTAASPSAPSISSVRWSGWLKASISGAYSFHADAPNQKWVTDVTEFNLKGQKLYLSPVLDLYNSEIIAWQMATHQGMQLVDKMLDEALARLQPSRSTTACSPPARARSWPI